MSNCFPCVSHPKHQRIYKTNSFQNHKRSNHDLVCSLETILIFPTVVSALLELPPPVLIWELPFIFHQPLKPIEFNRTRAKMFCFIWGEASCVIPRGRCFFPGYKLELLKGWVSKWDSFPWTWTAQSSYDSSPISLSLVVLRWGLRELRERGRRLGIERGAPLLSLCVSLWWFCGRERRECSMSVALADRRLSGGRGHLGAPSVSPASRVEPRDTSLGREWTSKAVFPKCVVD